MSISRILYNVLRAFTTEREWFTMSDTEKRVRLIGREHVFLKNAQELIPYHTNVYVLISSQDILPGIFYKTIYYLYPRKIVFVENINAIHPNELSYIIIYSKKPTKLMSHLKIHKIYEYKIGDRYCLLYKYE